MSEHSSNRMHASLVAAFAKILHLNRRCHRPLKEIEILSRGDKQALLRGIDGLVGGAA
jgi:hypothetical protein